MPDCLGAPVQRPVAKVRVMTRMAGHAVARARGRKEAGNSRLPERRSDPRSPLWLNATLPTPISARQELGIERVTVSRYFGPKVDCGACGTGCWVMPWKY